MSEEQEEPSIEEILDSIRQIISDDEEEGGEEAAPEEEGGEEAAPEEEVAPEPEPEPEEEVIELTDKVEEEEAAPEPIEVDMLDADEPEPVAAEEDFDSLLTSAAEGAAYEGFSELAKKTAIEHSGITVEEIVRSELRPLLRDWLDTNLPSIIERLVQEELERVAKRAAEE